MPEKPKIAMVGVGQWGRKLLAELVRQTDVVIINHGGNEDSIKFLRANYPTIQMTSSLDDTLAHSQVEAVVVAVPTSVHFDTARQVIASGKHLFLEKPAGRSGRETAALVDEAKNKRVVFAVGYEFVHHPIWAKLKTLILNAEVESVSFEWFKWGSFNEHPLSNLFCHDLSLLLTIGIVPTTLVSYAEYRVTRTTDIVLLNLLAEKTKISSYINRASQEKKKKVVVVTDRQTYLWDDQTLWGINRQDNTCREIATETTNPVTLEIADFLRCVTSGATPIASGELAERVWQKIEMIGVGSEPKQD